MLLQAMACEILLDGVLNATFLELAIEGARVGDRYRDGAQTRAELLGRSDAGDRLSAQSLEPSVRVRVDRWIVEEVADAIGSRKGWLIREFVREAVIAFLDRSRNIHLSDPDNCAVPNDELPEAIRLAPWQSPPLLEELPEGLELVAEVGDLVS